MYSCSHNYGFMFHAASQGQAWRELRPELPKCACFTIPCSRWMTAAYAGIRRHQTLRELIRFGVFDKQGALLVGIVTGISARPRTVQKAPSCRASWGGSCQSRRPQALASGCSRLYQKASL